MPREKSAEAVVAGQVGWRAGRRHDLVAELAVSVRRHDQALLTAKQARRKGTLLAAQLFPLPRGPPAFKFSSTAKDVASLWQASRPATVVARVARTC